jgi:hypothetical protein
MDTSSSAAASGSGARIVLGTAAGATAEDPFGPGDPLAVARLVRRALADAGRKAFDVSDLLVAGEAPVAGDALERFARRALGPHGTSVRGASVQVEAGDHDTRRRMAIGSAPTPAPGQVTIAVVLGPGEAASVVCLG